MIIDGKKEAEAIRNEIRKEILEIKSKIKTLCYFVGLKSLIISILE